MGYGTICFFKRKKNYILTLRSLRLSTKRTAQGACYPRVQEDQLACPGRWVKIQRITVSRIQRGVLSMPHQLSFGPRSSARKTNADSALRAKGRIPREPFPRSILADTPDVPAGML